RVGERVVRRLGVQHEGRLVRQATVLVGLGCADDRDAAAHPPEIAAHPFPPAGRKCGRAISSVASWKTTSTGMPMRSFAGSGTTPTGVGIRRGPSAGAPTAIT